MDKTLSNSQVQPEVTVNITLNLLPFGVISEALPILLTLSVEPIEEREVEFKFPETTLISNIVGVQPIKMFF